MIIYMMIWLKILGLKKKRGWFIWWFDWRCWDQKKDDDLYDDLIEDFGIKKIEDDLYDDLMEDFGI